MLISKNFWARFAAIAVLGVSLAACSGDDGDAGPAGPPGPTGPQGPQGPAGPSQGVPVDSAELINIEVTSIAVPAGGGAPVVELTLTNDLTQGLFGLPAGQIRFVLSQLSPGSGGSSSEWQSYVTRDSAGIPDAQATTETATAGTWVDNGNGTYQYTFAQALTAYPAGPTYDETKTHRLGIEIRGQAPISSNGIFARRSRLRSSPSATDMFRTSCFNFVTVLPTIRFIPYVSSKSLSLFSSLVTMSSSADISEGQSGGVFCIRASAPAASFARRSSRRNARSCNVETVMP